MERVVRHSETAKERDLCDNEVAEFAKELRSEMCCGFAWILKDEPENVNAELAVDVAVILLSDEYMSAENPTECFQEKMKVSQQQIELIAEATIGQNLNINWLMARRFRITGSNFGALIGSIKRNRFPQSLFDRLMGELYWDMRH